MLLFQLSCRCKEKKQADQQPESREGGLMKNRLEGIIDLHIHAAPDVRERKLDDLELMEIAVARNVRGMVIKSHNVPTMDRATLINRVRKEKYPNSSFQMFGGIALNRSVGGINPWAVESALKLGAKLIWLPTNTSENHYAKQGPGKAPAVPVIRDGKVVDELQEVFRLIKEYDAVLETGHISPEECFIVAAAARDAGVKKIVVTHPEFWVVGMSIEDQERIVKDYDVLLEHVYAQPIGGGKYRKNLEVNAEAMKRIGCEHFIVGTDSGQTVNPYWYESIGEYIDYLYDTAHFSEEEIDIMSKHNPGRMLGIETE